MHNRGFCGIIYVVNNMIKISNIKIPYRAKERLFKKYISKALRIKEDDIKKVVLIRKSLDARMRGNIAYVCTFAIEARDEASIIKKCKNASGYDGKGYEFDYKNHSKKASPVIVGMGPAGLFCGLMLARAGLKPTIIERGENVDDRKKSVDALWQRGELNENSNVQFGEGGAGTFSDGKLTCGVNDIRMDYIKKEFVKHGSPDDIITNAKPHIGTDYLALTVKSIREEIISLGGKVLFNTMMTDVIIENQRAVGIAAENVNTKEKLEISCSHLVCAIGHSSRQTYELLLKKGAKMEKKPFSVGVRIEHKREYINKLQYKECFEDTSLPTADYKLSCHPDGRGAYTFCMCPGGQVVASASETGGVVTNGMSNYARDAENSNSAVLVSVLPEDIDGDGVLSLMHWQRELEQKAFDLGGGSYFAPCQRLGDFLAGVATKDEGSVKPSYMPGVKYADLNEVLPEFVAETLKKAFLEFDKKMKGFLVDDALLTGLETRSSAPVRILRDESFQSNIKGLYPIGEGAGYAGGIMSSAADGIKCAEIICSKL